MSNLFDARVLSVHHWTDRLFSFTTRRDRFMLCGSPGMPKDARALLEKPGLAEGNMSHPGHYVVERAFVDK
jgi:ferredoxin-NADP reductase